MPEHRGWRAYQWPVVWSLGVVAWVLGWIGFWNYDVGHGETPSLPGSLYHSLQLFVLHCPLLSHPNWQLEVARFLAPVVFGYTATQAFLVVFHHQLQLLWLRFAQDHVIICGLGRKGIQLVEDFRKLGKRVVVIDKDVTNDLLRVARELGATLLIGDATDMTLLDRAQVRQASLLFAVTGDDGINVEIAVHAHDVVNAQPKAAPKAVRCFVHIVNLDLRNAFRTTHVFKDTGDSFHVSVFNSYENSARLLLRNHPLDYVHIGVNDPRHVHLIVLGFGQMGQSVALQAARLGHFANGLKLRITVVDKEATQRKKRFCHWYSQFDQVCMATFIDADVEDAGMPDKLKDWCTDKTVIPTLALCFDNESRCLSVALNLLPKLKGVEVPILVRMVNTSGLATLLTSAAGANLAKRVHVFGSVKEACAAEVTLDNRLDLFARASHLYYRDLRLGKGEKPGSDPSLEPWEKLDENFRESNRQQADHIPVKLRAIKCCSRAPMVTEVPVTKFEDEEVEILARMEHERFCAERRLGGWTLGPKNVEAKTNPTLISWDALDELARCDPKYKDVKDYDRNAVRAIPELLNSPHLEEPERQKVFRQR